MAAKGAKPIQERELTGLKYLSQQDDLAAFYWLSMTVVALGAAFVGGAVFCGWICPTGTLQEWADLPVKDIQPETFGENS